MRAVRRPGTGVVRLRGTGRRPKPAALRRGKRGMLPAPRGAELAVWPTRVANLQSLGRILHGQMDSGSEGSWFDPRRGNRKRRRHLGDGGVCVSGVGCAIPGSPGRSVRHATRVEYLTARSIVSIVHEHWTRSPFCRSSPLMSPLPSNCRSRPMRPTGNWRGPWASHMARRTTRCGVCRPRGSFARARGR